MGMELEPQGEPTFTDVIYARTCRDILVMNLERFSDNLIRQAEGMVLTEEARATGPNPLSILEAVYNSVYDEKRQAVLAANEKYKQLSAALVVESPDSPEDLL